MSELLECPCCNEKPAPCPHCGKPGKIYCESIVGCSDFNCGSQIDFGHWYGIENGIPAVHWVIKQWNRRHSKEEIEHE